MASYVNVDMDSSPDHGSSGLHFQDIAHSGAPDAHGGSGHAGGSQTHTFSAFPPTQQDSEDEDQADLLHGERKQPSFWTFEYYQQFFDVDTHQVARRILGSMLPMPHKNYLQEQIRPNPDMYGPFWICTTLVFTTAITGNLANYIQHAGVNYQWSYDFHKVTFSATAIFCYWWVLPTLLYLVLRWRSSVAGYSFLEIICVYGYSLAIYIPISVLWVVQYSWFQWLLVVVAALLSGSVLVFTFWPAVKADDRKVAAAIMASIILLHTLLAAGFMLYFFHVPDHTMPDAVVPSNNATIALDDLAHASGVTLQASHTS